MLPFRHCIINVKLQVTLYSQSHWDWLPPEIPEYILSRAHAQHTIDEQNRKKLAELCSEFHLNLQLTEAWGLGFIPVTQSGRILGMYHDIESVTYKSRFLGIT